jgi:hypothetical protein
MGRKRRERPRRHLMTHIDTGGRVLGPSLK